MVVEELLGLSGPVHHLVINTGDVEHQANHQTETCTQRINSDRIREEDRQMLSEKEQRRSLYSNKDSCTNVAKTRDMERPRHPKINERPERQSVNILREKQDKTTSLKLCETVNWHSLYNILGNNNCVTY